MSETNHENGPPRFTEQFRADLQRLFQWRRDVRRFKRETLPEGTLERLIEVGCLAPSVGLSEPWRFAIVDDPRRREGVHACFSACNAEALRSQSDDKATVYARLKLAGLEEAPGHIAVFADRTTSQGYGLGRRTMPETIEYSAVMAIHTIWLAARAEGLGVGWISILDPARITEILDVPAQWSFIAYLCVGYPAEEHKTPALEREGWEMRRAPVSTILRR